MRKLKTHRRPEILDAALAVADRHGLHDLSMRRIAEHLGLTPMALYGYFTSKDDLLDAIVGRLIAESPLPSPDLGWREQLTVIAAGAREVARRHPATFPLLFSRPAVTPNAVQVVDVLYRALVAAGVPDAHVPRVERMFSTFMVGFAISEVSGRFSAGTTDTRGRREQLSPGELPGHHQLADQLDAPVDWDTEFAADLEDMFVAIEAAGHRWTTSDRPGR